jgi:drug/metabolite transporter (DMT)-like permease
MPNRAGYHDGVAKSKAVRAESVWAALGGVLAGYVVWLVAISIGDAFATAGVWGPILLIVSVVFAVGTTLWGRRLRRGGNLTLTWFVLAAPILPVLLSLLVVADSYL